MQVQVIPAKPKVYFTPKTGFGRKKRVAAYARVSTESEEQANSYQAQVEYYTSYISGKEEWELVKVYTDEGISGTTTKKRDGFNKMIEDSLEGKIDMILTKSCSRFARNTVTTLTTVRQLREKGVDVYFEKESIHSMDSKGELLLTIMSSLAQDESRNISENIKWGHRQRFSKGQVYMTYKAFLGYKKGEDGKPEIVEDEAKVVRLIYKLFLAGKPFLRIAKELEELGYKTPRGKEKWQTTTIKSILTNEKYKGDCLLQKTYSEDFINKKIKRNTGELPQYYVKNSHPAIIDGAVFDKVQRQINGQMPKIRHKSVLSGKLICSCCNGGYGPKVWHSTTSYKSTIWQCNNKYKKRGQVCETPSVKEYQVVASFMKVVGLLEKERPDIIKSLKDKLAPRQVVLTEFNEDIWFALVDKIFVETDGILEFKLWDGTSIKYK